MNYFEKHALYPPIICPPPEADLALIVTIPCHDEPDLLRTLSSLAACELPKNPVEVIVGINSAENAADTLKNHNAETYKYALDWAKNHNRPGLQFHILHFPDLPPKHAGVGLARKIAMDEAARRLAPNGVIACLDADTQVQPNYLQALEQYFEKNPGCPAANIHYEHPLEGDAYPPEVYAAITRYELHLRYYVHALRWAGLPTATQTVGSAMAVRADAYQAQGGMNRRQAGEDFYFLHKFTPLRGFGEIKTTTVIPSPRVSHRVPFGTGKAVGDMLAGNTFLTYAPQTFRDLKVFLEKIDSYRSVGPVLSSLPPAIAAFLEKENFPEKLRELQTHTATPAAFRKRFFRWFDAFRAMKYVHYARDFFYPNVAVEEAALELFTRRSPSEGGRIADFEDGELETRDLLRLFRRVDNPTPNPSPRGRGAVE